MSVETDIKCAFPTWYSSLRRMKQYGGRPAKGTVAAALVVLERLRETCELNVTAHLADGGAQIAGLSLPSLRKILGRFGETRVFPSEGGRTNRGNNKPIANLLRTLRESGFGTVTARERGLLIDWMQERLVHSLSAYYILERVRFDYDPAKPVRALIAAILHGAQDHGKGGQVAQHLVGAKLALRFPDVNVGNYAYSAADDQAGRAGDFRVGATAFHVTIAPTLGHVSRCGRNIQDGLFPFLVVPDAKLITARTLLETQDLQERVAVESIESFVGQNISELAGFTSDGFAGKLADLLTEYNKRVEAVETDMSLMIEVPTALRSTEV